MAYQVLARKWRPQEFASLVGQQPIVTALGNALGEGRIAQAYLFSGIRGVGKTTTARLLAKALNCERGPTREPCNECPPCLEITRGADLDVVEVDAATYSKVEQVRELTESLRYTPARDRYKVVVIDEIHRLSRQAFDALLKIVEEPPPHLVFIFATTEIEAVPATVLSRCQEFRFRRVPAAMLAEHLRGICDAEELAASDNALRLIARAGEGSVRDAVALLDQLATFGSGTVRDEDAARLTGSLDAALFHALLAAILGGRPAEISATVRRVEEEGWDPRHVYGQFLSYCRDALHLGIGGAPEQVELPADDAAELARLAAGAGYENLLRLAQQLLAGEETVRRSDAGALAVEIAWLRAAELPKLLRVEEILGGGPRTAGRTAEADDGGGEPPPTRERKTRTDAAPARGTPSPTPPARRTRSTPDPEPAPVKAAPDPEPAPAKAAPDPEPAPAKAAPDPPPTPAKAAPDPEPTPAKAAPDPPPAPAAEPSAGPARQVEPAADDAGQEPPPAAPTTTPRPAAAQPSPEQGPTVSAGAGEPGNGELPRFYEELGRRRQPLLSHLRGHHLTFTGGELLVYLPTTPEGQSLSRALGRKGNQRAMTEAVHEVWGESAGWRTVAGEPEDAAAEQQPSALPAEDAAQHPTVQAVLDIFGGTIETVQPQQAPPQED